ncbi:MAG TPA: fibronectin type III domain-containing protein, partial [Candidatus Syntrophosphaera sp.]|nr:fibronectin type III domain-containing protein [Candidatus Syntrophosphaera sp.]
MVRQADATAPTTTYTASEWDSYPSDTTTYLGSHTMAGGTTIAYVSGYQNLNVNNVTTYNVTGLTPGTTYYYVVRAYNAYGTSDDSNEIEVTTTSTSPLITLSASTLTGFTYMEGSGPSAEQSFTVSGSNLTANISIDAPTDYQISIGTGANFDAAMADPLTLTQSGGTVGTTTIYVRLKAGLSAGDYNGEVITASSTGATNQTVTCSGTVTPIPDPALDVSVSSLSGFSYIVGAGPSASMYFTVSGTYLTNDIEVTAPTSYEVSADDITFTGSITLTAAKLDVAETTLYVRLKQGLAIGHYAEDLTVSTTGATNETIALSGDVLTDDIPFLYWDFNDNIPASSTNWTQPVTANFGTGSLTYTFTQAYSYTGITLNTMAGDLVAGGSFVPRGGQNNEENNGAEFVMTVNTTDLENIVLTYATQRTSTGFTDQALWYSLDGGQNYTLFTTITSIADSWEVKQIDFASVTGANDNPNFMVKIVLTGASSESGNNRFDNISFFGDEEDVNPVELASFTA